MYMREYRYQDNMGCGESWIKRFTGKITSTRHWLQIRYNCDPAPLNEAHWGEHQNVLFWFACLIVLHARKQHSSDQGGGCNALSPIS